MSKSKFCFLLFIISQFVCAQTITKINEEFDKGIDALQRKDTTLAIKYFQESIRKDKSAPSHYELAKIYWQKSSPFWRGQAFESAKAAVMINEKNIEHKYFYADLCKYFTRSESVNQWKEILKLDPIQIRALINPAEFHRYEFEVWNNSIPNNQLELYENNICYSNQQIHKWAMDDFSEAVNYYEQALKIDSANIDLCIRISLFYEANNLANLGLPHLLRLINKNQADKRVYLCYAFLNYRLKNFKESNSLFYKALTLMNESERRDFTINTTKLFFLPTDSLILNSSEEEINAHAINYWNAKDPLILTSQNERLLEHYSRVAYSILSFTMSERKIIGWKTNAGETIIRYGRPLKRIGVSPTSNNSSAENLLKSVKGEIWDYQNFKIVFEDSLLDSNLKYSGMYSNYVRQLHRMIPTKYEPEFAGPIFELPYKSYQFASISKKETDVYISYGINLSDSATSMDKFSEGYQVGLFLFDADFNKTAQLKTNVRPPSFSNNLTSNSLKLVSESMFGNLAFEMIRKKDKGVASYHGKFNVQSFNENDLQMSDLVLAIQVDSENKIEETIQRKNISVVPNPSNSFSSKEKFFIYFELYGLSKHNDLTDFVQTITLQRKDKSGVFETVLNALGIDKDGERISLTSKYKTEENNTQLYMQLDISEYGSGDYILTVGIKDNLSGKEVSKKVEFVWR